MRIRILVAGISAAALLPTGVQAQQSAATPPDAGQALPSAVIEVNALLLSTADQRVVASRTFTRQQPASSTAVADVVTAFEQGLAVVVHDIAGWTLAQGQADAQRSH